MLGSPTVYATHCRSHFDDLGCVLITLLMKCRWSNHNSGRKLRFATTLRLIWCDVTLALWGPVAASRNARMAPEPDPRVMLTGPSIWSLSSLTHTGRITEGLVCLIR